MPKFTREFIQKVQDKAKEFDFEEVIASTQLDNFLKAHEDDLKYDPETFENDETFIHFLALANAGVKEEGHLHKKLYHRVIQFGYQEMGNDFNTILTFISPKTNLNEIESIENGIKEPRVSREAIEIDDDDIVINNENNNTAKQTTAIFDRDTLERAKSSYGDPNSRAYDLKHFEENHKNDKLTVYSALKTKLENLTTSAITPDMLSAHRDDAQELLSIYAALQRRSVSRTIGDIIKHPFKTFAEWIMKGKVKDTLETKYGINDKQLETLTQVVQQDLPLYNYHQLGEDGKMLNKDGFEIDERSNIIYDKLGKDTNLESEELSDTESVISNDDEKVREEEPDMFV